METHDFMNVETFSQLPFIRPPPVKEKGIRLFGKEFGSGSSGDTTTVSVDRSDSRNGSPLEDNLVKESDNGNNLRKFECNYCFRSFPTSQALGGHQNAHKRERQQGKRAQLQSSAYRSYYSTSYRHFGVVPPPPSTVLPLPHHQSWSNNISSIGPYATTNPRFYDATHPPPSPLGLWRIPTVQSQDMITHDHPIHNYPLPLFVGNDLKHKSSVVGGSSNSQPRFVYEGKPSIQDRVSLDLHL